jgi:hypothetical protein
VGANACAAAKTSWESKENNTDCVSTTPLFLHMFPCSRNITYPCIDTKLSIIVGHWNKPRMTYNQQEEDDEIMHIFIVPVVYIRMSPWPPPFMIMGRQGCDVVLKTILSQGQLKSKKGWMMMTSLTWIKPHPHEEILRHILNMVNLFLRSYTNYLYNRLLPNDLIIVRNYGDEEEDVQDTKDEVESPKDVHSKADIQTNSEVQSLISSSTRSPGPPYIKIDAQYAYNLRFGCFTYAQKEYKIMFKIAPGPSTTKIGFDHNCQNKFNF